MSTWTNDALQALEGYLEHNRGRVASNGADADEVVADLRRHVEEEVAALELPVVTQDDVQRIVTRIGPVPSEESPDPQNRSDRWALPFPSVTFNSGSALLMLVFGVILPLVTIGFELITRLCAGTFFDPMPTLIHLALVTIVPLGNATAWLAVYPKKVIIGRGVWWINGAAFGVSLFYSILFLPMSPFAAIGILYLGFGLLPLAPLFAFGCAWRLRILLRRQWQACSIQRERAELRSSNRLNRVDGGVRMEPVLFGNGHFNGHSRNDAFDDDSGDEVREERLPAAGLRAWAWSAALPVVLLTFLALPGPVTRYWLERTASESPAISANAVQWLRSFGSRDSMLKACYGRGNRLWLELFGRQGLTPELAQKAFYRVTGKPYNSFAPPLSKYQRAGQDLFGEFDWDAGLGGDTVAGQVRGLSLTASRIDGVCQPDEAWSYLEWTLEFENIHSSSQREARAQIQLPPGGVVSRLTLWVNGEEREAAFAGRSHVREAYRSVAVVQRRDPVLVTTSGPDTVLMQCFPIEPRGGRMKVRLGITTPLVIESAEQAALKLPSILERNFAFHESVRHSVWLESAQTPACKLSGLILDASNPLKPGIRGAIADAELNSIDGVLRFPLTSKATLVRARDRKSDSGAVIRQTLDSVQASMPNRVAIVLDGSKDMTEAFPQIARALDGLPSQPELTIWLAQDGVRQIFNSAWNRSEPASAAVGGLRGVGGQDDLPALLQAWEWAAAKQNSVVLWIHPPQPVLLGSIEALKQRLEWRGKGSGPAVLEVSTSPGPNRIVEQLSSLEAIGSLTRLGSLEDDLERLFATWSGRRNELRLVRELETDLASIDSQEEPAASFHLVRLWARDQIQSLAKARKVSEAIELAGLYQLVTVVSGAVVLETMQQFTAAGLTPVDPLTVPAVPEPSSWMLLALGFCFLFLWRRRPLFRHAIEKLASAQEQFAACERR
jgi:hypothetical protein